MTRMIKRLIIVLPAIAAATFFEVPSSQAQYYGNAYWCAVTEVGTGEMQWDCEYQSIEACVPNVLAGNRGFCSVNPYWRGSHAANTVARPKYHKRHRT